MTGVCLPRRFLIAADAVPASPVRVKSMRPEVGNGEPKEDRYGSFAGSVWVSEGVPAAMLGQAGIQGDCRQGRSALADLSLDVFRMPMTRHLISV